MNYKITSIPIIIIILVSFVIAQECDPQGDINTDGQLNLDDAELLKQILVGESEKAPCADVDEDGDVDKDDYELQYKLITSAPGYEGEVSIIFKEGLTKEAYGRSIKLEKISYDNSSDYSIAIISVNGKQIPINLDNELYTRPVPHLMPMIYEQGLVILVVKFNEEEVQLAVNKGEEPTTITEIDFQVHLPAALQGDFKGEIEQNKQVHFRFYADIDNLKFTAINRNTGEKQESDLQKETINTKDFTGPMGTDSDNYETMITGTFSYGPKNYGVYISILKYYDTKTASLTIMNALRAPSITLYPYGCDIIETLSSEETSPRRFRYETMKNEYSIKINSVNEQGTSFIVNDETTPILNNDKNYYMLTGPSAATNNYITLISITKRNNIFYPEFCLTEKDELNLIPTINKPENIITKEKIITSACEGCLTKDGCVPFGTRIGNKYCDRTKQMLQPKRENTQCTEDLECDSNLCVDNRCTSRSLWKKFTNWLKGVFS